MKAPAFQFYPDKWQSHTRRLSDSAYRTFHEMLCWAWQHAPDQCSVPADPGAISCLLAMPADRVQRDLREIQNPHAPLMREQGGRLVSNGLRKESLKQQDRREKASGAARMRWEKDAKADAMPTQCERNANASIEQCLPTPTPSPTPTPTPSPTPATQEEKTSCADPAPKRRQSARDIVYSADFLRFWEAYPRKKGKQTAFAAFKRAKGRPPIDDLVAEVRLQARSIDWTKQGGEFVPHPATWLNSGGWEDEVIMPYTAPTGDAPCQE